MCAEKLSKHYLGQALSEENSFCNTHRDTAKSILMLSSQKLFLDYTWE